MDDEVIKQQVKSHIEGIDNEIKNKTKQRNMLTKEVEVLKVKRRRFASLFDEPKKYTKTAPKVEK